MDIADLYDHEITKIGPIYRKLIQEFSRKPNTKKNLDELEKRAKEEFLKIGLIVEVNTAPALIIDPNTMRPGFPEIVIMGRVPGSPEEKYGFDHELKRAEVLVSKERGEDFAGQKYKPLKQ
ncbi:MAG: hypothetical protein QXU32_02400 [Nitrososphaerales archaeon]